MKRSVLPGGITRWMSAGFLRETLLGGARLSGASGRAPEGWTAIVLEMPCFAEDPLWSLPDGELRRRAWRPLQRVKPIEEGEVLHFAALRLPFACPVLEAELAGHVELLVDYFGTFENLHLTGRNSLFRYLRLHDLFREGRELVSSLAGSARRTARHQIEGT